MEMWMTKMKVNELFSENVTDMISGILILQGPSAAKLTNAK